MRHGHASSSHVDLSRVFETVSRVSFVRSLATQTPAVAIVSLRDVLAGAHRRVGGAEAENPDGRPTHG
jgi:hypothetical protein